MRRLVGVVGLVVIGLLTLVPALGATGERAGGTIIDSTGATLGQVELTQEATGVRVVVRITDEQRIRPGNHGIHFHAVGRCDIPDFTTAGGHFNPAGKQHGAKNPQGAHAGDLPNLPLDNTTKNQNGTGYTWVTTTSAISLTAGATSIFDADGTALVIHADPDDEATDPTGNSGGRTACAVISQQPNLPNTGQGGMANAQLSRGLAAIIALGTLLTILTARGVARRRR